MDVDLERIEVVDDRRRVDDVAAGGDGSVEADSIRILAFEPEELLRVVAE